jgi:3'(2'), 5'-bisphosphate nucleotidase
MRIDEGLLSAVEEIAREAGRAIMVVYARDDFGVRVKSDDSPLTEADAAAHALIAQRLKALTPALPLLSEEDVPAFPGPDADGRYWLVDPLDGTKEFIKRNGEFTVNIALIENGKPVLSVVYAPVLDTMYSAVRGMGAFRQDKAGRVAIRVAEHRDGTPWRVVGSRSHAGDSLGGLLQRLGAHELVSMGSSLKLCLVADGSADIYPRLGPTMLWDTAAAQCVVEQAGGRVVQMNGEALGYGNLSALRNPFFLVHGKDGVDWRALLADIPKPQDGGH